MSKRKPYRVCPECGSNLDSSEQCECQRRQAEKPVTIKHARRNASYRQSFENYLDERQREWLYS